MHLAAYRRALKARNRSERTIQNYEETLLQLARFHDGADILDLDRAEVEEYIAFVLQEHASSSAGVRFRALRAFYNWTVDEEILDRSPMARMKEPSATEQPVPVLTDEQLRALLKACAGKDFESRRDTAIIRLFCEPGSPRVSEMAGLLLDGGAQGGLDMKRDLVRVHGKGDKIRDIPFGPKTGQALDRYLLVRRRHRLAALPQLWLGGRGAPLTKSGIAQMLRRRGVQAGVGHVHPHQLRHTAAHVWHDQGGSEADAMALFGWSSAEMPRRYGASARVERAHRAARRTTMADRL
jgi:site-specific recombinase XerD